MEEQLPMKSASMSPIPLALAALAFALAMPAARAQEATIEPPPAQAAPAPPALAPVASPPAARAAAARPVQPQRETAQPAAFAPSAPSAPPASAASAPSVAEPAATERPASSPVVETAEPAGPPPAAVDTLNPGVRIDPDAASARVDLWNRIRTGYAMPVLDNDLVRKWEQYYAGKPNYMQRMIERGGRYLFHVVEELDKRGMPLELALLPFVESAFNPQAMSSARASGMWQFIPSTGRDFQLKQNIFRDDRRDVLASTQAALEYLERLHEMFGDWQHALAAYNWGQGNVQRAIARNQQAGLPTDYASLNMPDETRNYVPKLMAIRNLIAQPQAFAIELPPLENHPYFLSVPIDRDIDVALAAKLAHLPQDEFRQLNPQMNKPVILAAGTPQVLLPYDNANTFVRNLVIYRGRLASWTAWVAPRTMKSAAAAAQAGMSESEFRDINRIPPRMLVKAGSTLLVPRSEHRQADVSEHVADNAMLALAPDLPPMKRVKVRAPRKGATVAAIARQYRMSVSQVAALNRVGPGASFRAGQAIVVLMPARAPGRAVATARGGKVALVAARATPHKVAGKPVRVANARPAARPAAKAAKRPGRAAAARVAQR
jgi:membrane-bound lytic murein transglycosylase D